MSDVEVPETVSTRTLLRGPVFEVVQSTIRYADGDEVERVVVQHPGAVAMIALDDAGRWLLVRQYRHPARRVLLEIPAGTREPGEPPAETAARELREETGFAAGSIERIGGAWMAPGFCSEYIDFYLATALRPDPLPQDEDERISPPEWMTLDEIMDAAGRGEIEDAKTLVAVMLWRSHRERHPERNEAREQP